MKKLYSMFFIFTLTLNACNSSQSTRIGNKCIPSTVKFDYPFGDPEGTNLYQESLLPLDNWKKQTSSNNIESIELVQQGEGRDYIWAHIYSNESKTSSFVRFQPAEDIWQNIESDELFAAGFHLVKDNQDIVWYIRKSWYPSGIEDVNATWLGVYEKSTLQFRTLLKISDMLREAELSQIEGLFVPDAKFDSQNNLWLALSFQTDQLKEEYRLFKYSLSTLKIERILPDLLMQGNYADRSFVISRDDTLFLWNKKEDSLIQYNLEKNSYKILDIPAGLLSSDDPTNAGGSLFLDSTNKLWLTDYGWADLSSSRLVWHKIVRSPIFIHQQLGNGIVVWTHPDFSIDTQDGRLWYSSLRGSGWVNPDTAQWCLFTTYQSNIVEDSEHNLWIAVDGNLYKYDFEE